MSGDAKVKVKSQKCKSQIAQLIKGELDKMPM